MNGRTAQESRLPVNGTAAANGTNGHGPQPEPHLNHIPPEPEPEPEQFTGSPANGRTNGTALGEFTTPVRVDEIAVAAMALSENLQAATRGMPESPQLRRFRRDLDQAAHTFRSIAGELEATAGSMIRLAATEGQACGVGWGVCPDHGLTLMNVGESVTCHVLGCHNENEGAVERCVHPVAYRVVDAAGPALFTCAGHAIACRLYLDDAVITLAADSLELF